MSKNEITNEKLTFLKSIKGFMDEDEGKCLYKYASCLLYTSDAADE